MNRLDPLSSKAALLLQFAFTAAFAGIGPFTSAIVFRALKNSSPNSLEKRRAFVAFIGCCVVDAVFLCHLVLFLWCCNRVALSTKLRPSESTQTNVEKPNIQRLRISNPVSVVKNPPASSASEKALMDAKAAILGEQPVYDRSAGLPSSLLLSVFDQPDGTQTTIHEISVDSGIVCSVPALAASARSDSGRASPLSTSPEFERQYPRLSQDFNAARLSQGRTSTSPTSPTRPSQSVHSHTRPSQRLNGARSSGDSNFTPPHLHNTSSPNFSSTPLRPSSLRKSVSQTQPPAPAHLPNSVASTHNRDYSSPFPDADPSTQPVSQPPILPTESQPSMTTRTSFGNRPRNFSHPEPVSYSVAVPQTPTSVQQPHLRQHNPQFQTPPISTAGESRSQAATEAPGLHPSETYPTNRTMPMIGTAISTPDVSRPSSIRSSNVQDSAMSS